MSKDKLNKKELKELKRNYDKFSYKDNHSTRKERYSLDQLDKGEDVWYT